MAQHQAKDGRVPRLAVCHANAGSQTTLELPVGGARAAVGKAPPDLARDIVVGDDGAHLEPAGAAGAGLDVHVEGPGEQRGPRHVRGRSAARVFDTETLFVAASPSEALVVGIDARGRFVAKRMGHDRRSLPPRIAAIVEAARTGAKVGDASRSARHAFTRR
jgi:hypothetical protein